LITQGGIAYVGVMRTVEDEGGSIREGMESSHLFQFSPIIIGERQVVIKGKISSTPIIMML